MKILWISPGLMPEALDACGLESEVYGGGWISSQFNHLKEIHPNDKYCVLCLDYRPCDVMVDNVRYVSFGRKGEFNYKKVPHDIEKFACKIIAEFDPDIIHIHGTEYFYGCMSSWVYCNKPTVVSIQGVISECSIHYGGGLIPSETWWTNINPRLVKNGYTISRERAYWKGLRASQERKIFQLHNNFIGRTEWDHACVALFNPKARYYHVDETLRPIFMQLQGVRDCQAVKRHSIYCGAAAAYPLKGVHFLLRAIHGLKNEFPDIELRIAASDFELATRRSLMQRLKGYAYGSYLRRLIRKFNLEENVVALPRLNATEVVRELSSAELFVLPSLCENSPNSLGEAMIVGTPAIATYAGGTSSILKDGEEGRLVPTYSAASLAYAIAESFRRPDEPERMAEKARKTALKRHNGITNAIILFKTYETIIQNS